MQYRKELYSKELHDRWVALSVRQPFANDIMRTNRSVIIGSRYTQYRGDVMVCSKNRPFYKDYLCGATIGLCNLYDVKKVSDLTDSDWNDVLTSEKNKGNIQSGWAYFLSNPRRVIEFPVDCGKGFFDLVYTKDVIIEYPEFFYFKL